MKNCFEHIAPRPTGVSYLSLCCPEFGVYVVPPAKAPAPRRENRSQTATLARSKMRGAGKIGTEKIAALLGGSVQLQHARMCRLVMTGVVKKYKDLNGKVFFEWIGD